MRDVDLRAPKFLDQKEPTFRKLHGTMDSLFRKLRQEGVGAVIKHAGMFTAEKENLLWVHTLLMLITVHCRS